MTASSGDVVSWPARAGGWLGIGSSPAALVLGVGLAARHAGAIPVVSVVVGTILVVGILASQGSLGMAPPHGMGMTLTELAPRFLRRRSRRLLSGVLAAAMVGWFGFNVGLGGAALAALTGFPTAVGVLAIALPIWVVSAGGMRRWNGIAVVATVAALLLGGVTAWRLAAPVSPLSPVTPPAGSVLTDLAGFIGYVSVFGVRAPDFSVGLRRPRDLAWCVSLLVGSFLVMAALGALLFRGTGDTDLVGLLAAPDGWAIGNLLVAVAVVGPSLTITYSGSLALRSLVSWSDRVAISVIVVPGLVLASLRFDRLLLPWLSLLAALLPALVVAMGMEASRRRRGREPHMVPAWTWVPASGIALVATLLGVAAAPVLSVVIAAVTSAVWSAILARSDERAGSEQCI